MSTDTSAPAPGTASAATKWLPTNPFDIPETKELVAQKIAMGEITQYDVDIMQKGYRWMIYTPPVTAVSFSFLIWQLMKKQYPRPRMITRLFWGGVSLGAGGFLGFGAAGVAAAMEVEDKMDDVQGKSMIFEEIAEHSRALQESKLALLRPSPPPEAISPRISPAQLQAERRKEGLPRDFELPPTTQGQLNVGAERMKEETKSTWGYVKSWVPGWGK